MTMESSSLHHEEDQPSIGSPDEFDFDPDCTLILYGLHGRNNRGLLKKFQAIGTVTFWQPVTHYDTAIVAYATPKLAQLAKTTITDEKILFCTVRDAISSSDTTCAFRFESFDS